MITSLAVFGLTLSPLIAVVVLLEVAGWRSVGSRLPWRARSR